MAPKKGGDKKGGKEKKKDDGPSVELTEKDLLEQAKLRIELLEHQLVWREEKLQQSLSSQRELEQRVQHYHADFAREKEGLFDISADMTRQYKGMQEELLARLNKLEETIQQQKDDLEKSQLQLEEVRREKAQELAQKDAEIQEQKAKMEVRANESMSPHPAHFQPSRSALWADSRAAHLPCHPCRRRIWPWNLARCSKRLSTR